MIDKNKRYEKERAKDKQRRRIHVEIDPDNYDYIPEVKQTDYYDNDVPQRVAIYVRVSTDDVRQTILESEPSPCNRETLTRKSGTEQLKVGQLFWVNFSQVAIVQTSFFSVDGFICLCSIRINFSVSNTLVMTCRHQAGMETSDTRT